MLCFFKNIDGRALICIGLGLNTTSLVCGRFVKNKPGWLQFLLGLAVGAALVFLIVGAVRIRR